MSYSRSSFKSTSSAYRLSGDGFGDDSNTRLTSSLRSSARSSRFDSDDLPSLRRSARTSIGDDYGTTRRTSRGISIDDDTDSITSGVRRSTRLSSRLMSEDDGDSSFASRRATRLSSTGDDDFSFSSRLSKRNTDEDSSTALRRSARISRLLSEDDNAAESSYGSKRISRLSSTGDDNAAESSYASKRISRLSSTGDDEYSFSSRISKRNVEDDVSSTGSSIRRSTRMSSRLLSEDDDVADVSYTKRVTQISSTGDDDYSYSSRISKKTVGDDSYSSKLEASSTGRAAIREFSMDDTEYEDPKIRETKRRRDAVAKELIETEEDFCREIHFIANTYMRQLESSITPQELKDKKETLFGCFREISQFHNDVLMKGIQYYAKEPAKIGCTFVRLEREFDKHVRYCRDLPEALKLLESGPVKDHYDEYSLKIKDEKRLEDHLKLPVQRINDYQLLLKELLKYSTKLEENTSDIEKALELMQAIPQRATDLQYISNIEGYKGNLHKLGRLLKHDWFDVIDNDGNTNERFVFLFRGRMFITDVNSAGPEQRTYAVKNIVKLQSVDFEDVDDDRTLKVISKDEPQLGCPFKLRAKSAEQKDLWKNELKGTRQLSFEEDDDPLIDDRQISSPDAAEEPSAKKSRTEDIGKSYDKPKNEEPMLIDKPDSKKLSVKQMSIEELSAESRISESNEKVEMLKEFEAYEELNTVVTDTIRSGSMTSIDEMQSITSIVAEDDSVYFTASSEIDTALTKPTFKRNLRTLTECEGETVKFDCLISANPTPSIQWLKDNRILHSNNRINTASNGNKHSLTINDINVDDAGLYTIAVTNSQGTASSSAPLNVTPLIAHKKADSRPSTPGGTILPHAPEFKVKLPNTELMEGTTVRFELVVRGLPHPAVKFYKDGKELIQNERIGVQFESKEALELIIEHVTPEDAGEYKCVAMNSEGKDTTIGKITVTKDKVLFLGLEEDSQPVPDNKLLSPVDAIPRPRTPMFKWFKDGKEFEASERFQVQFDDSEDTIAMVFQHVTPEDAGLYTCVASTSSGKIACSAELTVQGMLHHLLKDPEPPMIKLEMADVEVSEGASAMLEVKVTGYPKPKITWYKGDKEIESGGRYKFMYEDDESYTLVIKNANKDDAGMYRVKAENDLGDAETTGRLTVTCSPKFKKQMKDQSVMTDETLKLEVAVEASPAPQVKWFKDGQQIKENNRIKICHDKDDTYGLIVEKVKIEDAGSYSCVVSNDVGQQSSFSQIIVNAPPAFINKMKSVDAFENDSIEFNVKLSGIPKPIVKFLKNENLIKADGDHIIISDDGDCHKLIINGVKKTDAGNYQCVASNDYGTQKCESDLSIKVKNVKPNFTKKLQDYESRDGDEMIELTVKVEGVPTPKIKWFHEGIQIDNDGEYQLSNDDNNYTLKIPKVTPNKSGEYKCEATNSEGKAQTTGKLTVNSPPSFTKKLEDINVGEDEEVRFNVKVVGSPNPTVNWYRDGVKVKVDNKHIKTYEDESNSFTLIIDRASKSDAGEWKAEAVNVFGKVDSTGKLGISMKPRFVTTLCDTEAIEYDKNVVFIVKTERQPLKPIIRWYIDEREIQDNDERFKIMADESDDTYKLIIRSATEDLKGRYKCAAENNCGISETSAKFTVMTKPKFIKGLKDIEAVEGETVSMTVKVSGCPAPEVTFLKEGKDVSTEATVIIKQEQEEEYILEIENIHIIMSGEYVCHLKNTIGECESKGTVIVNSKPKILKDLEDKDAFVNEETVLEVEVTGNPTPDITWYKNGIKVKGTERILLEERDVIRRVKFDTAQMEDDGIYNFVAENKIGKTKSKDAKLTVNDAGESEAPIFIRKFEDSLAVTGDAIRFEAKVAGKPEPNVKWFKDDEQLKPKDRIIVKDEGDNTHVLIIRDLIMDDNGMIKCKAENNKGEVEARAVLTVQEPEEPKIKGLSDSEVSINSPVKFDAIITGIPKPTVYWYKDDHEVETNLLSYEPKSDRYSLTINKADESLMGTYKCIATNIAGEAHGEANLIIIKEIPKFIRELESDNPKLESTVLLEAEIIGFPTPDVSWYKNGEKIVPNNNVKISQKDNCYLLEIKSVRDSDLGEYMCIAENEIGQSKSICQLKVPDAAPTVEKKLPTKIDVKEGETLKIEGKVCGQPPPEVQWTKDGEPLKPSDHVKVVTEPDGTVGIIIDNALPNDAGKYQMTAKNPCGEKSSSSDVEIKPKAKDGPPIMLQKLPSKLEITEGEPLKLIAKVEGVPQLKIQWAKDGVPLKQSDKVKLIKESDGTIALSIDCAQPLDAGKYEVSAVSPKGVVKSSSDIFVAQKECAPIIEQKLPVKLDVTEGEVLVLKAKVEGVPQPQVQWSKDGVPIKPSNKVKIITEPDGTMALTIDTAQPQDSGRYEISAVSPKGEASSSSDILVSPKTDEKTKPGAPVIKQKLPNSVEVVEGEPLKLVTKVDGHPPPEVKWSKDGAPIKPSDHIKIVKEPDGTVALTIDSAQPQDAGKYEINAVSPKGEVSSSSDISVSQKTDEKAKPGAPVIKQKLPNSVEVAEGEPLKLVTKVDGHPPPEVKWSKDGVPIKPSDHIKIVKEPDGTVALTIDSAQPQDAGKYEINAVSPKGEVSSSSDILISPKSDEKAKPGAPVIKQKLPSSVKVAEGEPLRLVTKVEGHPQPEISLTKDGVPIKPSDHIKIVKEPDGTVTLCIEKTKPEDAGKYEIKFVSPKGTASSTSNIEIGPKLKKVEVEEIIVQTLPPSIQVSEGKPIKLVAKVESHPPPQVKWSKDGVPIKLSDRIKVVKEPDGTVALTIDNAQPQDAGKYEINAVSPKGEASSSSDISVSPKTDEKAKPGAPVIKQKLPNSVEVAEGEPLKLVTKVDGRPPPEVKWSKDGVPIKPSDHIKIVKEPDGTVALTIDSAQPQDAGKYEINAVSPKGEASSSSDILVSQKTDEKAKPGAPVIKQKLPNSVEVAEGEPLKLVTKVDGRPPPEVKWSKDGVPIKPSDHIKIVKEPDGTVALTIDSAQPQDAGKYEINAVSPKGEASSSSDISVSPDKTKPEAPIIKQTLPNSVEVAEGEPLKLVTKVEGHPQPEINWSKDGVPIKPSDHITIVKEPDGTTALCIEHAKPEDAGKYEISAVSPKGTAASSSDIEIGPKLEKGAPIIAQKLPPSVQVSEGKPIKLEAKIEGEPKPKVEWSKDDAPLTPSDHIKFAKQPDGGVSLSIESAKLEDAGKYSVTASSPKGTASSMSDIAVSPEGAPVFEFPLPNKIEAFEGKPLKLETKISGEPIPEVQWSKDGVPVEPSQHIQIVQEPDGTSYLSIDSAKPEDAGKYSVCASSPKGDASSASAVQISPQKPTEKPKMINDLKPLNVTAAKPCRLQCQISGEPNDITWFKNGKEIMPDDHMSFAKEPDGIYALIIDSIRLDDAGEYSIVAKNGAGQVKSSAPVKVTKAIEELKEKPVFIDELKPTTVVEGETLTLKAKYKSDIPIIGIKWMKDGQEIVPNDRITFIQHPDGTVILKIDNATPDDEGKYVVVAINDEGRTRSGAPIQVTQKPHFKPGFVTGLSPTTLTAGNQGKLSVQTEGAPEPEVRFVKNGQQIMPDDRIHIVTMPDGRTELVFDTVIPEDEGKYIAIAINDEGETRSSAPVIVNKPPTFNAPLQETVAIEGYPGKLELKVEGEPKPEITWTKNGEPMAPDEHHIKAYAGPDGTHALIFDKCSPNDSGTYCAFASNKFGKTESAAPFTVKSKLDDSGSESSPIFVEPLQDASANEGESMTFHANIKALPLPDIKWFLEGQPMFASDNIHMSFDGMKAQLTIRKCNPQHKGLYELKLTNSMGEATSKAMGDVIEKSAPKFIQRLSDTEAGTSEPFELKCRVIGFPQPDIEWYYNGDLIEPGIKYSIYKEGDLCRLVIVRPRDKDSGVYECKARNKHGTDTCRANVNLNDRIGRGEPASFLKKLGDCEVREGQTAKFTACVTGSPKPEIKWFKNGEEFEPLLPKYNVDINRNGMIRFEIRNVEQSNLGEYRCHATNIHGYDNSTAQLRFEYLDDRYKRKPIGDQFGDYDKFKKSGIPVPLPDKPRIVRMSDNDLTLSWLPSIPSQPRVPVTYQVEWLKLPDGQWTSYRTGIKDNLCDVRGLSPGDDYSFRIRVENKHGVSDPSPYVTAYRSKLRPPTPAQFKPKDYEIEHPPLDKHPSAPRFLRHEEDTVYAIKGQPVTIEFWVYAHPDPTVLWYFEGEKVSTGGKYDTLQDRNGQLCLFITRMKETDVGTYSCHANNDHGEAQKKIRVLIAEPPVFTKRLEETTIFSHRHARLECTVIGTPVPKVKWYKDWQVLGESNRIKILWEEPDRATLFISDAITRDAALYSCSASNVAGSASTSAMLHIEESEIDYDKYTYGYHKFIRPKTKPFEEFYDIGDELGRGTQGIIYHAVERSSGKSYAAKMMHGKDKMRDYMNSELEILNQLGYHPRILKLCDAFDLAPHSLTLVTDLCGGGEILECVLQRGNLTESVVAHYIKQILQGLEYMHMIHIAHFGLTIGDILVERINGDDIKIGDFGLAQKVIPGINYYVDFGHPEFVAPEIVNKQPATFASDMWSVGIITYIMFTGMSPFFGANDRETLHNIQSRKLNMLHDLLLEISEDGRDFLSKLLDFDPSRRLDVKSALQHPWLRLAAVPGIGDQLGCIENLRDYHKRWKNWYVNASCKRYYRRRPLDSCFTHPSKMIYPPDEQYTPPQSPDREPHRSKFKPSEFDETFQQKIQRDHVDAHSESQYQCGPDTYLLQLRDTDFPTRVRQYLRVGASRSPSLAANLREPYWGDANIGYGFSPQVAVRERRRFTDVMDEEIDDERKGLDTRSVPMRLLREVGTSGYAYGQLHHLKQEASHKLGKDHTLFIMPPYFREKIKDVVIKENDDAVFCCYAIGEPSPSYTWFRNDGILIESSRVVITKLSDGRCELRLKPARAYDMGQYKCIARNENGAVVTRARLNVGDIPGQTEPPQIKQSSDTEVYVCWSPPKNDGSAHIACYRLEYQKIDAEVLDWTIVADNIVHEFYVVRNLEPETSYYFRVSARNKFGWSETSSYSEVAKTQASSDSVRILLPKARKYRQTITERSGEVIIEDPQLIPDIDYNKEINPVPLIEGEHSDLYNFVAEISKGKFSLISKTYIKEMKCTAASKAVLTDNELQSSFANEYEILKSLAHERIVSLISASRGSSLSVLVMERLSGIDVLTFLSQRQQYNEEIVAKIIQQVLDGIEYLHFRGICLLELQPDNVVMINQRRHDIKLCDFANARYVLSSGAKVSINGTTEYIAPEIIKNDEVSTSTDIWCVGILTYILLSGVSPFRGSNDRETAENITYVRYRFDNIYPEVTQEAIRFMMTIFKLTPYKRPTIEECSDNRWLMPNEFMIRKRENALFSSHKLTEFSDEFHSVKSAQMPKRIASVAGICLISDDPVDSQ